MMGISLPRALSLGAIALLLGLVIACTDDVGAPSPTPTEAAPPATSTEPPATETPAETPTEAATETPAEPAGDVPAMPRDAVISGVIPDLGTPIAPGEGETGRVSIEWTDNSTDEEGFRIYQDACESGVEAALDVPANETMYGPLNPCRPARIGVAAFNEHGESDIAWGVAEASGG